MGSGGKARQTDEEEKKKKREKFFKQLKDFFFKKTTDHMLLSTTINMKIFVAGTNLFLFLCDCETKVYPDYDV